MNHTGTIVIETPRIILRPFTVEDAPAMYRNWASDPEVTRFLTWPTHASEEVTRSVLTAWTQEYRQPNRYEWCVVPRCAGEAMGSLGVTDINESEGEVEIGYCLSRSQWGLGLMPEAVQAVLRHFFNVVGAKRVLAKHDTNNPKSGRVMQKSGMTLQRVVPKGARNNQGVCDIAIYAISREEFHESDQPV